MLPRLLSRLKEVEVIALSALGFWSLIRLVENCVVLLLLGLHLFHLVFQLVMLS